MGNTFWPEIFLSLEHSSYKAPGSVYQRLCFTITTIVLGVRFLIFYSVSKNSFGGVKYKYPSDLNKCNYSSRRLVVNQLTAREGRLCLCFRRCTKNMWVYSAWVSRGGEEEEEEAWWSGVGGCSAVNKAENCSRLRLIVLFGALFGVNRTTRPRVRQNRNGVKPHYNRLVFDRERGGAVLMPCMAVVV